MPAPELTHAIAMADFAMELVLRPDAVLLGATGPPRGDQRSDPEHR